MNQFDVLMNELMADRAPMQPLATDIVPRLTKMPDVRAVIFDVYGTLVISGSGDVGSADPTDHDALVGTSLTRAEIDTADGPSGFPTTQDLHAVVTAINESNRSDACPKPEIDIVAAWHQVFRQREIHVTDQKTVVLAAVYEAASNPTWPMPGAAELLAKLRDAGVPMGIVSNAQVFTPPLVQDLIGGRSFSEQGFDLDLCLFSNRYRQAKPGPRLFDALRSSLARRGLSPHQAVYVGNDMLNDVWAASMAGLRTAWFAGDARSCRPRSDDPRCRSLMPDVVLTDVRQLLECLEIGSLPNESATTRVPGRESTKER